MWTKEGTEPLEENYYYYYFNEEGLNVLFPPYQVGSWAEGEKTILIRYDKIKSILKSVDKH